MFRPFAFTALLLSLTTSVLSQDKATAQFTGKLSALSIPASDLEGKWTGPTGLVVDDLSDLSSHTAEVKAVVEPIKEQVSPLGVIAFADFTYRHKDNPLRQITLRVFVFDSAEKCSQWWQKKYQYEGWQQHYSPVAGNENALDSKETSKRAVAFATVWLTCGSLNDPNAHIEVLNQCVKRIRSPTR